MSMSTQGSDYRDLKREVWDRGRCSGCGGCVKVTATLGIASFPEHAMDKESLTLLADKAMYKGKTSTRNVVNVATI